MFPKGPWGPDSHLQRGGIAYDYIVPGDPLTPGWASMPGAQRIPIDDAVSVPKIMARADVVSRHPADPRERSADRRRRRNGRARCRSSTASAARRRIRMQVDMQTDVQPNYVVEGRIRGSELPG